MLLYGYSFLYSVRSDPEVILFCSAVWSLADHSVDSRGNNLPPHIPDDVLYEIFGYCDHRTLCTCSSVCKYWNVAANRECHWENLGRSVYSVALVDMKGAQHLHAKALFKVMHAGFLDVIRGQRAYKKSPLFISQAHFESILVR